MILNFNPRTLWRVRLKRYDAAGVSVPISIHAPCEGCDFNEAWRDWDIDDFNPRTLWRVRQSQSIYHQARYRYFNPRTLWRVRRRRTLLSGVLEDISIHAPCEGCDWALDCHQLWGAKFQSTHPVKGATSRPGKGRKGERYFNPRTLWRVRLYLWQKRRANRYFNPRTLWRVRRRSQSQNKEGEFQSTHPVKGATAGTEAHKRRLQISIHAPCEGCDFRDWWYQGQWCFISIHAPCEGCDN